MTDSKTLYQRQLDANTLSQEKVQMSKRHNLEEKRFRMRQRLFDVFEVLVPDEALKEYSGFSTIEYKVEIEDLEIVTTPQDDCLTLHSINGVDVVGLRGFDTRERLSCLIYRALKGK